MTPNPQGLQDVIAIFDREFKGIRLDKEEEKLWPRGIVYQSGETNNLFLAFNRGVAFGMAIKSNPTLALSRPQIGDEAK